MPKLEKTNLMEQVEVVDLVHYEANVMAFFIGTKHSIHGVTPRSRTPFTRKLVNLVGHVNDRLWPLEETFNEEEAPKLGEYIPEDEEDVLENGNKVKAQEKVEDKVEDFAELKSTDNLQDDQDYQYEEAEEEVEEEAEEEAELEAEEAEEEAEEENVDAYDVEDDEYLEDS